MGYDVIQGQPPSGVSAFPAGAQTVTTALDTNTKAEWVNPGTGWQPVSESIAKAVYLAQVADIANVLTFTAPVSGLYRVSSYAVSTVATSGTLPAVNAAYTDVDTAGSITAAVAASAATSAANTVKQGSVLVNAKAGTTIVVSTASYATTTFNLKARIAYLG